LPSYSVLLTIISYTVMILAVSASFSHNIAKNL